MGFLNKLFGGGRSSSNTRFSKGDVFYVILGQEFHIFKLLHFEQATDTYNILTYRPQKALPNPMQIPNLEVEIFFSPVAATGFENPKLLTKSSISSSDLKGYYSYLREQLPSNEIVKLSKEHYKAGYSLTTQKQYSKAIDEYEKAILLIPNFFEAIDNRAFCFMDMAKWEEAIQGFEASLAVNPNSFLALFSIGECYFKMKNLPKAREYFLNAKAIDDKHPALLSYLERIRGILGE
jgi:tetratricopeptide (TPR) repeat protein